jgi:hypothetical protein
MPLDPRDYKLELSGTPAGPPAEAAQARPFLSVLFACCNIYQRIYKTADGTHYRGRCPRCGRAVQFSVSSGGTDCRFFIAR